MPLFPTIDYPHQIQPKPPLDDLTVDDLRHIYDLKTMYPESQRDILCEHLDDAIDKLDEIEDYYSTWTTHHNNRLAKYKNMLKDPRCEDPSAILHAIEVLQTELNLLQTDHDAEYPKVKAEHDKCVAALEFYDKYEAYTANEIWSFAAKKFHKDVSKPMPHPCALQDPLYHGAVTDDMDDPEYEPNGG